MEEQEVAMEACHAKKRQRLDTGSGESRVDVGGGLRGDGVDESLRLFVSTIKVKGNPWGLVVGTNGMIYVSDTMSNAIQCYTSNGTFVNQLGKDGKGDSEFKNPQGLSTVVYHETTHLILEAMRTVPPLCSFPPGVLPICAAYIGNECLIVCDTYNHRMQVLGTDGTFIRKWGNLGTREGQFEYPYDCSADVKGTVYVVDSFNHRVQVFDANGAFIRKWGTRDRAAGQFEFPQSVSVSRDGLSIYVADPNNSRIVCYHPDGTLSDRWAPASVRRSVTFQPSSVLVDDSKDKVYAADNCNRRVLQYRTDGAFLRSDGRFGSGDGEFDTPEGMAIAQGILYIADRGGGRIVGFPCGNK